MKSKKFTRHVNMYSDEQINSINEALPILAKVLDEPLKNVLYNISTSEMKFMIDYINVDKKLEIKGFYQNPASKFSYLAACISHNTKTKKFKTELKDNIFEKYDKVTGYNILMEYGIHSSESMTASKVQNSDYGFNYSNPLDLLNEIKDEYENLECEKLLLVTFRDDKVFDIETISVGNEKEVVFAPKDVITSVFESNCNGCILIHNHPSGDSSPSIKDLHVYEKMKKLGNVVGFDFKDSIVYTPNMLYSTANDEFIDIKNTHKIKSRQKC